MDLELLKSGKNHDSKYHKLSVGEYIEVSYKSNLVAEFDYFNDSHLFVGYDYTEDLHIDENHYLVDLEDEYRIDGVFNPKNLLDLLNEWSERFPELHISGRTFLEERIDNETI
jgi:hypothetical protein